MINGGPKEGQERPRMVPRRAQDGPRWPQAGFKRAPSRPKNGAAQELMRQKWPKMAPRDLKMAAKMAPRRPPRS